MPIQETIFNDEFIAMIVNAQTRRAPEEQGTDIGEQPLPRMESQPIQPQPVNKNTVNLQPSAIQSQSLTATDLALAKKLVNNLSLQYVENKQQERKTQQMQSTNPQDKRQETSSSFEWPFSAGNMVDMRRMQNFGMFMINNAEKFELNAQYIRNQISHIETATNALKDATNTESFYFDVDDTISDMIRGLERSFAGQMTSNKDRTVWEKARVASIAAGNATQACVALLSMLLSGANAGDAKDQIEYGKKLGRALSQVGDNLTRMIQNSGR